MTNGEAVKVIKLLFTTDSGCPACVKDALNKFRDEFGYGENVFRMLLSTAGVNNVLDPEDVEEIFEE